jgi:Protein of unknown function (DUF2510)
MGLFDRSKPDQQQQQPAHVDWDAERARIASFLYRARNFTGTGPEDPTLTVSLRPEERALLVATSTYLVEPKRVRAHWAGAPGGFTFDASRPAHLGGGDAGPTPVDAGDVTFTTQRIIFAGRNNTREWEYSKLLGYDHVAVPPWTMLAVSDQPRVSGIRYDHGQADEIRFAMVLGIARFSNDVDSLVADLQEQLDEIDRLHPTAAVAHEAVVPAQAAAPAHGAAPAPPAVAAAIPPPFPSPSVEPQPASEAPGPPDVAPADDAHPAPAPDDTLTPSSPPLNWGSDLSPTVTSLASDIAGSGHDEPVPTGEIPASPPTATYPAVGPQRAAEQQVAQQGQHQGQPGGNMPPGWYPDPWRLARVRWWDGYAWTAYTSH